MDDITNYRENIGKPLDKQTFELRVSYEELIALRSLAQNPHPDYLRQPSYDWEGLFETLKEVTGYASRKYTLEVANRNGDPFA